MRYKAALHKEKHRHSLLLVLTTLRMLARLAHRVTWNTLQRMPLQDEMAFLSRLGTKPLRFIIQRLQLALAVATRHVASQFSPFYKPRAHSNLPKKTQTWLRSKTGASSSTTDVSWTLQDANSTNENGGAFP